MASRPQPNQIGNKCGFVLRKPFGLLGKEELRLTIGDLKNQVKYTSSMLKFVCYYLLFPAHSTNNTLCWPRVWLFRHFLPKYCILPHGITNNFGSNLEIPHISPLFLYFPQTCFHRPVGRQWEGTGLNQSDLSITLGRNQPLIILISNRWYRISIRIHPVLSSEHMCLTGKKVNQNVDKISISSLGVSLRGRMHQSWVTFTAWQLLIRVIFSHRNTDIPT